MYVRVGPWRRLSTKELMHSNCGAKEDSWESLGQQGNKTVNSKRYQPWIFTGRTDAQVEASNVKRKLIGKNPDAEKDWRKEKGVTEDKMVGWHHRLNGHEFEQARGDSEGQGSLVCCSPWGHGRSDITGQLNKTRSYMEILNKDTLRVKLKQITFWRLLTWMKLPTLNHSNSSSR